MKKLTYQNLPKMQYACSKYGFSPSMNYVEVTKDTIVATTGSILVKHSTRDLFSNEFIEAMPNKFYVHHKIWGLMTGSGILRYEYDTDKNAIIVVFADYEAMYPIEIELNSKYPNWKEIIPKKKDAVEISEIAFALHLIPNLQKSLFRPNDPSRCKFTFFGIGRPILVEPKNSDSMALLMPLLIND